jgi:putative protease
MFLEATAKQLKNCENCGVFAYGRAPAMLLRACPQKALSGKCCGGVFLTDEKNTQFPLFCTNGDCVLYNSLPVFAADKLKELLNFDHLLLYFTTETAKEAADMVKKYENGGSLQGNFTRGRLI